MITFDRGTPRIARLLGASPLEVRINGTLVPWTEHSSVTISRAATHGNASQSTATAQITLAGNVTVRRGDWLTVYLSTAAVTALGGSDAHRFRFAGRITDATVAYRRTGPTTLELIAAGVLPSLRGGVWNTVGSTNHAVFDNALTQLHATAGLFPDPPLPAGAAAGVSRTAIPSMTVPSANLYGPFVSAQWAPRVVLNALADSAPGVMLAEHRDGSIIVKRAGVDSPAVATLPAPAAASLPRAWPVNDVTVTYGPTTMTAGLEISRQLVLNSTQASTANMAATNGTHSISGGVNFTATTTPAASGTAAVSNSYSWIRDGKIAADWLIHIPSTADATKYSITAVYYNTAGTVLRTDTLTHSVRPYAGGKYLETSDNGTTPHVLDPPTTATYMRLFVNLAAGAVANGTLGASWQRASLVTLGHGTWTAADAPALVAKYFNGNTADTSTVDYGWSGTAGASVAYAYTTADSPAFTLRLYDPTSIADYGTNAVKIDAYLSTSYDAAQIADAYLSAGDYEPPNLTLDVLPLLETGQAATARALLALELGHRVAAADLPDDIPQTFTDPTTCYVAGITETIGPGSWRVTIAPALIP